MMTQLHWNENIDISSQMCKDIMHLTTAELGCWLFGIIILKIYQFLYHLQGDHGVSSPDVRPARRERVGGATQLSPPTSWIQTGSSSSETPSCLSLQVGESTVALLGGLVCCPSSVVSPAGRRVCLGESLARMELFIFFSTLLQRFRFTAPPGVSVEDLDLTPRVGFTLNPSTHKLCAVPCV